MDCCPLCCRSPAKPLSTSIFPLGVSVEAATTRDNDFIRMEGLKGTVGRSRHRKELVAGGLAEYLPTEYSNLVNQLGKRAMGVWSAYMHNHNDHSIRPSHGSHKTPFGRITTDHLYSSNSPTIIVNTPLPGVSPSCTTIVDVVLR